MSGCGSANCGIQRERERQREQAMEAILDAFPGLRRPGLPPAASPLSSDQQRALGARIEEVLPVRALPRPPDAPGACGWLYLLAGLHRPCLLELEAEEEGPQVAALTSDLAPPVCETYVRVGFSPLGPYVTLQETRLTLTHDEGTFFLEEQPCWGVQDTRLRAIIKGLQGKLRRERLVLLDMAFLAQPLGDELIWSYLFDPSPPDTSRLSVVGPAGQR